MTTDEIDEFVHSETIAANAYPSPLRYSMFPKSVCTSVNNVVCHGIPDDRPLTDGDIINIDITVQWNAPFNHTRNCSPDSFYYLYFLFFIFQVFYNGYHGDCSKTFLIGKVDALGQHLVKVTEECLHIGIGVCGPNVPFSEIGNAIEQHAQENGLEVIKEFIGHGIGTDFHSQPEISHYRKIYIIMPMK